MTAPTANAIFHSRVNTNRPGYSTIRRGRRWLSGAMLLVVLPQFLGLDLFCQHAVASLPRSSPPPIENICPTSNAPRPPTIPSPAQARSPAFTRSVGYVVTATTPPSHTAPVTPGAPRGLVHNITIYTYDCEKADTALDATDYAYDTYRYGYNPRHCQVMIVVVQATAMTTPPTDTVPPRITPKYTFDPNGSLISKDNDTTSEHVAYTYNLENRLIAADIARVEKDSQGNFPQVAIQATYAYNQSGIRTRANSTTTVQGQAPYATTRVFLNDAMNLTGYSQVLEEFGTSGLTTSYVYGDDEISQTTATGTRWFSHDGHGNVRGLTDGSGLVTDRYNFDAYGMTLGGDPNVTNPAATDLLYSGEQFDTDLQMQYLRARYYDQSTGTFASLDPAAGNESDPQTLHKHLYAGADPVNCVDPNGEEYTLAGVMAVAAVSGPSGATGLVGSTQPSPASVVKSVEIAFVIHDLVGAINHADILMPNGRLYGFFRDDTIHIYDPAFPRNAQPDTWFPKDRPEYIDPIVGNQKGITDYVVYLSVTPFHAGRYEQLLNIYRTRAGLDWTNDYNCAAILWDIGYQTGLFKDAELPGNDWDSPMNLRDEVKKAYPNDTRERVGHFGYSPAGKPGVY
ncbi:MAG: hypothetical protein A3K19_11970 [Lentisphaerae bacterium RIFOXYB12_FULL_65_16]|nr:MAG: hypothetical protein A3K18_17440 [Lentisphaerae bacterium RIFOXYA12_64_32]OGV95143.1 MAG: hypothetical protein A3K19_11970 [Lentisphaerae bacterium RIFOXYB12_FULL_65_16]